MGRDSNDLHRPTDHQDIVGTNKFLVAQNAALKKPVADLSNQLPTRQDSPPKTVRRVVPQEAGPSKPDRVLTDREKTQTAWPVLLKPLFSGVVSDQVFKNREHMLAILHDLFQ